MRIETRRWLRHADEDWETARVTLAGQRWAATSFFAQQAAEKALKALWLERNDAQPPRTHDLVRLAEDVLLPNEWHDELDALSRVYLLTRYPGMSTQDGEENGVDEPMANGHLKLAERVISWVKQQPLTAS